MLYCTKSNTEATKGLDQRNRKGTMKDGLLFESWVASNSSFEFLIYVGIYMIVMVKTNKTLLLSTPSII